MGEIIILIHRRTNHPILQSPLGVIGEGEPFTLYIVHHQRMVSRPVIACRSKKYPAPPWSSQRSIYASYTTLIRGSLNDTKLFSESQEFDLFQGLRQNVGDLFICIDMLDPYCSSLYHIPDIVVPDIDVLGAIRKYRIL